MRARMPRKKVISMILKYVCIYLVIAVGGGLIITKALYNYIVQYEREVRKSCFKIVIDGCQEYLDQKQVSFSENRAVVYFYTMCYSNGAFNIFQDDLPLEIQAYLMLEDAQSGEFLTDSQQYVYCVLRFNNGEGSVENPAGNDKDSAEIAYCPVEIFEEGYLSLRENQASLKGRLGERIRNSATWEEFWDLATIRCVPLDLYRKEDGSFLPGKVLLLCRDAKNWRLDGEVSLDPDSMEAGDQIVMDLTPANVEGYEHLEHIESNFYPSEHGVSAYLTSAQEENKVSEAFRAEAMENFERIKRTVELNADYTQGRLFPSQASFAMDGTIRDREGVVLRLCQYVRVDNLFWGYMELFRWYYLAGYGISLILFLVILRHALLKKKYAYETECYRKMLVDIMAHDLKTPLTAAGGYAESLKEHLHTEKMEYYAEELQKNIAYMNEIISTNLTISKMEFEKKKLQRKPVDLVELCQQSIEKYQPIAEEKKCTFAVSGKTVVRGDGEVLLRVFDNLVMNAVKYAVPESEIQVTGKGHEIRIRNITEQELEGNLKRLWEPFVRGDENRSGEKGTGIGLYIAAKILDDHKWKYRINFDKEKKAFECVIMIPWGVIC